ncbi:putative membrane protein [Nitrospirillum amazonense]|uniref:Putative membrane protein n=1 Tax=Nitrospirillum amazonense TaxID=28077 RepID=A0A560FP86_9PROT|nr:DUF2244 domain-containing protein [Nitrospirillum amazonense]TWB23412.1 putative membrane protein [Nitrospirillum amazonense]
MPSDITAAVADWATPARPVFDATITPPNSLSDRGFLWFMGVVLSGVCLLDFGLLLAGYWLVLVYLTGDMAFLLLAFFLWRRAARRWERVRVADGVLVLERWAKAGQGIAITLPLLGLNLVRVRDATGDCRRLELHHRDRRLPFAADLTSEEREAFADNLGDCLHRAGFRIRLRTTVL